MKNRVFTQKEIETAKNMSIVNVVESLGYPLKKTGRTYSYGNKHKLRIYPEANNYYDFSTGKGGSTIHFVRRHFDTSFPNAMEYLLNGNFDEAEYVEQPKEDFHYYFPHNPDTSVGKDYLINKRKLDPTLINFLFEKNKIRMDKLNQIIFPWQKADVIVGATVQGTTYDPEKYDRGYYKGIARNSESNFVYNISIGQPDKIYVFESPIDMLSYWSMNKDIRNATFISTNGAKEQAVFNTLLYLENNKCKIKDIYIGSDNDRVGQVFYQKMDLGFENIQIHKEIPDDLMIPREVLAIYEEVLTEKESSLDVRLLAAIHKTETNLSMTNECTSKEELVFYFGKKINRSNEKPTEYTRMEMKERVGQLVDDLEATRIGEHISLRKALRERLKVTLPNEPFSEPYFLRIEAYLEAYQSMEELLVGTPVKDWNDKLKQVIEMREQLNQATQSVNRTDKSTPEYQKTFINKQRQQEIRVSGSSEMVKADIFQTGQYAGSLEPSSPQEMEKLIESYGFMAVDKEDYAKYSNEKVQQQPQQAEPEFILE